MDNNSRPSSRALRGSTYLFQTIEHGIYVVLGLVLSLTALMALAGAIVALVRGAADWSSSGTLLDIIDRLLFVLMLAEILQTVRVSIGSGTLTCEPFLTVGLIASIRRVLVITLESSQGAAAPEHGTPFQSTMIELVVLGGLIVVMVFSIYLLRRAAPVPTRNSAASTGPS